MRRAGTFILNLITRGYFAVVNFGAATFRIPHDRKHIVRDDYL